jgi:Ankyrin repeats (3 copies)
MQVNWYSWPTASSNESAQEQGQQLQAHLFTCVPSLTRVWVIDEVRLEHSRQLRWLQVCSRHSKDVTAALWGRTPQHTTRRRERMSDASHLEFLHCYLYDAAAAARVSENHDHSLVGLVQAGDMWRLRDLLMCASLPGEQPLSYSSAQRYDGTDDNTVLHLAAALGHVEVLHVLLSVGTLPVDSLDRVGKTALHRACECAMTEAARALLEWGSDVNAEEQNGRGGSALTLAAATSMMSSIRPRAFAALIQLVCAAGADEWATMEYLGDQYTALRLVAKSGRVSMVQGLFAASTCSFTVGWRSSKGGTALRDACSVGSASCAKLLIEAGASAEGFSPTQCSHRIQKLLHAVKNSNSSIEELCIHDRDDLE